MAPIFPNQFREIKAAHDGMVIVFKSHDRCEMFSDDAVLVGAKLGIRVKDHPVYDMKVAEFPERHFGTYLAKLLNDGIRVAVCEQVAQK